MAILARGQITVTIAEKGEDGKDYNNYIGEWYIGTRGAGHSFEFSPAPADTTSAELKIYQKDLESEIRITLNGHTVVEQVGGVNGVLDWKTYKLNISHVHFTEYNVIRIEHNGSATADWGYIYRAIMQFSVKGDQGLGTANLYKASYEKPEAPDEFEMPPSGWSFTVPSDTMEVTSITYDSQNDQQWSDNGDGYWVSNPIDDSELAAMTIHFTTNQSPQTVAVAIKVSSERTYDKLQVCDVDRYMQVNSASGYQQFSGTVDKVLYFDVPSAGRHFIQFYYSKDSSASSGRDNAMVRMIPILPVKIWLSVATIMNKEVTSWSTPVQFAARDGAMGRSLFYRGNFNSSTLYYQDDKRVDVVKYNSSYYYYVGLNCVSSSWNANNWEHFSSEFECVATNLLLAENANIADWVIKDGKITSQSSITSGKPKALLDGVNGGVEFNSTVNKYTSSGAVSSVQQSIKISSSTARVEATNSDYETSYISSQGIFTNRAGIQALLATSGTELKAAVVALGYGDLQQSAYSSKGALCGLYADSSNRNSNPTPSWGAYIRKLLAQGLYLKVRRITTSTYLDCYDTCVACYNTSSANIYLPPNPQVGQLIIFTVLNTVTPTVYGNGKLIFVSSSPVSSYPAGARRGSISFYLYDGQYWKYGYLNA